jgi:deoxyribonuclease V
MAGRSNPAFRIRGVTPTEGIRIQKELTGLVSRRWDGRPIRLVAGTDVHFPARDRVRAAVTVLRFPELEQEEQRIHEEPCAFPYVPGLLSFREIPPLLAAFKRLTRRPDVILCDGQGIAHPRGVGLASHLGLILDLPSVGCAKSPLFGRFELPGPRKGDRSPLTDETGKIIGTVLRTRNQVKPLFISIGHRIDLRRAVRLVLACSTRYRIPEPLRAAHRLAGGNS